MSDVVKYTACCRLYMIVPPSIFDALEYATVVPSPRFVDVVDVSSGLDVAIP